MKKLIASSASVLAYGIPALVSAQSGYTNFGLNEFKDQTNLGTNIELVGTIASIINVLLGFLGILAVLLILFAGFKWMTSAGNEEAIAGAKKMMSAGVIGLAIILASYAIAAFILGQLGSATSYNY